MLSASFDFLNNTDNNYEITISLNLNPRDNESYGIQKSGKETKIPQRDFHHFCWTTFHPAYSEVEQHLNSQANINQTLMLCYAASDITLILSNFICWRILIAFMLLKWQVKYKDVFLWNDLDQDQWSMITQIMHGTSNKPMNPFPRSICQFLRCADAKF